MATGNISNRISIEGGDDVRKVVLGIRDDLERAFQSVKSLADQLGNVNSSGLDQTSAKLKEVASSASDASQQVQGAGDGLLSVAAKAALGIGALVAGASAIISTVTKGAAESAAAVQEAASRVGLTVESYQRLRQVADDAGISTEKFNQILSNVDRAATQAAGGISRIVPAGNQAATTLAGIGPVADSSLKQLGGGLAVAQQSITGSIDLIQKFGSTTVQVLNGVSQSQLDAAKSSDSLRGGARAAAGALAELGISGQEVARLSREQLLALIAQQLDKIPESAGKASVATKLLGADWRTNIELFRQGADAILNGGDSIRNLSKDEVAAGKALSDQISDLGRAFDGLKNRIGILLAPGATTRAEWLTNLIDGANKLLQGFASANAEKEKLADGDAGGFLDSFKAFLSQSGQTGLATAIGFIRDVSRDLATLWSSVLIPAGQVLISAFNGIAEAINSSFGTDISGRFVAIVAALGLVTGAFGGLRAVFSPVVALFGFLLTTIGSLGTALVAGGLAVRLFWTEFRAGGSTAITAVRSESAGFFAAFSQLARGNLSGAWTLFKAAALDAFDAVRSGLAKIFAGEGSTVFTSITRLISGVALAASGLAAIFNAIFGTNLNAEGLLLVAVIAQLVGAFTALRTAAVVIGALLTPVGLAFAAITASAIILARQFPDLGRSWELVTSAFSNLLAGDFTKAFNQVGEAFRGVWANLKNEGLLTWAILGAGAIALGAAVETAAAAVVALGTRLKALSSASPALAAIGTALALFGDVNRELDPVQQKMQDINKDFARGKIDLEEYNRQIKALGEGSTDATTKGATTARSFSDNWKVALDQIKAVLGQTGDVSTKAAAGIAPPFNKAAQEVVNGFRQIGPGVWQKVAADGTAAADAVASGFRKAADGSFNGFKEVSKGVWQQIPQDAKAATDKVTETLVALPKAFQEGFQGDDLSSIKQQITSIGDSAQDLAPKFTSAVSALQSGGSEVASQFQTILSSVQGVSPGIDSIVSSAGGLAPALQGADTGAQGLSRAFDFIASSASSGISSATGLLDDLISKLQQAASAAAQTAQAIASLGISGNGGLPAVPFAGGGFTGYGGVYEPAGVVHRGEYVQPQHVVRQPGVLAFMEMLRAAGGDLQKVFASFGLVSRGFSMGGLVTSLSRQLVFEPPRLSYAGGGLVDLPSSSGLQPLALHFHSGGAVRTVTGVQATPQAARELEREALFDRLRSSRLPSRGSRGG